MADYTTTAGAVAALREVLRALSAYSTATKRFGLNDLALLEEFDALAQAGDDDTGYFINVSADEAMRRVLDERETVLIGDGSYVWDAFTDDTNRLAERLGVLVSHEDDDTEGESE